MKSHALPILLALAVLAGTLRADTIHLQDGSKLENVRIVKETLQNVEYRVPRVSAPQKVESAEVRSIEYGSAPPEYRDGMAKLEEGALNLAAGYFLAAAEDEEAPKHVRADARVRLADALNENGNLAEAIEAYDQLLKEHPDTRHLARALLGRGKALFRSQKNDEARTAFETLESEASAKSLGERYTLEAEFHLLWITQQEGGAAEAIKGYEALLASTGGTHQGIANKCSVRLGRAKFDAGDLSGAAALFQDIIDSRLDMDARDVAAEAFNGRGRCRFSEAQAMNDKADNLAVANDAAKADAARQDAGDLFREARLDFLRVIVSYPDVQSAQAEAFYWAAQCYLNLDEDDAQREAGRLLKSAQRYENSQWGKKAKAEG
ncbi:MAG: tetratricopeptide repeat protein [Planctomycetota bacterium]